MKMISRRDFLKASAVVGATAAMTACGGSSSSTAASTASSENPACSNLLRSSHSVRSICCNNPIAFFVAFNFSSSIDYSASSAFLAALTGSLTVLSDAFSSFST